MYDVRRGVDSECVYRVFTGIPGLEDILDKQSEMGTVLPGHSLSWSHTLPLFVAFLIVSVALVLCSSMLSTIVFCGRSVQSFFASIYCHGMFLIQTQQLTFLSRYCSIGFPVLFVSYWWILGVVGVVCNFGYFAATSLRTSTDRITFHPREITSGRGRKW